MTHKTHTSTYIVIGGGMAGDAAIKSLLNEQPDADITLISSEDTLPYARPPLTKGLWTDPETRPGDIMLTPDTYGDSVTVRLARQVEEIDREARRLIDDQGDEYTYEKLLLATGGRPRELPGEKDGVIYFRTLQDYRDLQRKVALNQRIGVIGSGFIGNELAASLSGQECEVFMILPGKGIGAGYFPAGLSHHLNERYREAGVDLVPEQRASRIERSGDHLVICTEEGGRYAADSVVAGLGIEPNLSLAEHGGLEIDGGVKVDARLRTSDPHIYAAGDIASRSIGKNAAGLNGWNTRTTPSPAAPPPVRRWPEPKSISSTRPCIIPICSSMDSRPWGIWTPAWISTRIGKTPIKKASFITSETSKSRASCFGTSGIKPTRPGN